MMAHPTCQEASLLSRDTTTEKCAVLARLPHRGQRYGDHDYFQAHVADVVRLLTAQDELHRRVALLHDALEDTPATPWDLWVLGVPAAVIQVLLVLTRREEKGEPYVDYVERVARHPVAVEVKIADLRVNIAAGEETWGDRVRGWNSQRAKYAAAYARLQRAKTWPEEELPYDGPSADFVEDSLRWRGVVLSGEHAHWCHDWDGLPMDETCENEWPCSCADALRKERD